MPPLQPLQADCLAALPRIAHGFFTRTGGVSTGIYQGLNCGLGSADDRAAVIENRNLVTSHLGAKDLLTVYQVHSATAVVVEGPWGNEGSPKADAIVTKTPGVAVAALAADCTPVLFADPNARIVAAAHSGWRGAVGGVLDATIDAMVKIGADRAAICAGVGPTISQANYEVGPEFEEKFLEKSPESASFFNRATPAARPHFDLPGYVTARLCSLGLANVTQNSPCTFGNDDLFFSYRRTRQRGESDYGRQISAIVLE